MTKLFLALPSHAGMYHNFVIETIINALRTQGLEIVKSSSTCSELSHNFNILFELAIKQDCDYFLMLHDDVAVVEQDWVSRLLRIMKESQATVLCPVIRMKGAGNMVSTVLKDDSEWDFNPMKLDEALKLGQEKGWFYADCVNTGCMLVDMRSPALIKWNEDAQGQPVWFDIPHNIREGKSLFIPEDYRFCRKVRLFGGKVVAVTELTTVHLGSPTQWVNRLQ